MVARGSLKLPLIIVCVAAPLVFLLMSTSPSTKLQSQDGETVIIKEIDESLALSPEEVYSDDYKPSQNDTELLKFIRAYHLTPPSAKPYNLTQNVKNWKLGTVSKAVEKLNTEISKLFGLKEHPSNRGFFIECGANNGEYLSNTIHLEVMNGWTGLLVEVDPVALGFLYQKNRKAWVADVCLAVEPYPHKTTIMVNPKAHTMTFLKDQRSFTRTNDKDYVPFEAKCLPLFSLLSALNVKTVDYFSLDVEGAELSILKTIPFDSILIKVFSMEIHESVFKNVDAFLKSKGYTMKMHIKGAKINDYIYTHKSFQEIDA